MSDQRELFSDLSLPLNSRHWLYRRWDGIKQRCFNPNCPAFRHYGGRGIYIAPEWRFDFQAFASWSLANGASPNLQIDRKDNDGPYSPDNCRWVSSLINCNNRRNTRRLSDGTPVALAVRSLGLKFSTVDDRLKAGWSADCAVKTPVRVFQRHFLSSGQALSDAARLAGISRKTVESRLVRGWSPDDAVSVPSGGKRPSLDASPARLHTGPNPATAPVLSDAAQPKLPRNSRAASAHRKDSKHG